MRNENTASDLLAFPVSHFPIAKGGQPQGYIPTRLLHNGDVVDSQPFVVRPALTPQ
jgi:hypothetical protein